MDFKIRPSLDDLRAMDPPEERRQQRTAGAQHASFTAAQAPPPAASTSRPKSKFALERERKAIAAAAAAAAAAGAQEGVENVAQPAAQGTRSGARAPGIIGEIRERVVPDPASAGLASTSTTARAGQAASGVGLSSAAAPPVVGRAASARAASSKRTAEEEEDREIRDQEDLAELVERQFALAAAATDDEQEETSYEDKYQGGKTTYASAEAAARSLGAFRAATAAAAARRPARSAGDSASSSSSDALLSSVARENDKLIRGLTSSALRKEQESVINELGLSDDLLATLRRRAQARFGQQQPGSTPAASTSRAGGESSKSQTQRRPVPSDRLPMRTVLDPPSASEQAETDEDDFDEGTPEYIRRHFFPGEMPPSLNPNLKWMMPSPADETPSASRSTSEGSQGIAFDARGRRVPGADHSTKGGDTQHAGGGAEGSTFTLSALSSLASSAVPAQRVTALSIFTRAVSHCSASASPSSAAPSSSATAGATLSRQETRELRLHACRAAARATHDKHTGTLVAAVELLRLLLASDHDDDDEARGEEEMKARVLGEQYDDAFALDAPLREAGSLRPLVQHLAHRDVSPSLIRSIIALLRLIVSPQTKPVLRDELGGAEVVRAIDTALVARMWPPTTATSSAEDEDAPEPEALALLIDIARSSREAAKRVADVGVPLSLLRFFAVPPWDLETEEAGDSATTTRAWDLASKACELLATLARYAIALDVRTTGAALFDVVSAHVARSRTSTTNDMELKFTKAWLVLIAAWTVGGVDPHVSQHSLVWTQVDDFAPNVIDSLRALLQLTESRARDDAVAAACEALVAWARGARVNKPRRGADALAWLKGQVGSLVQGQVRHIALVGLQGGCTATTLAYVRLCEVLEVQVELDEVKVARAVEMLLADMGTEQADSRERRALCSALIDMLPLNKSRQLQTLKLLAELQPGDELMARKHALAFVANIAGGGDAEAPRRQVELEPFVSYALQQNTGSTRIAPLFPSPQSLTTATAQWPFGPKRAVLSRDWILSAVLDELMHSGASPVVKQLPQDMNEARLVATALALAVYGQDISEAKSLSAAEVLYNINKVFLLERDASSEGGGEVFRSEVIESLVERLLAPFSATAPQLVVASAEAGESTPLENVALRESSVPFFQTFTDLVGLYDSLGLGHTHFARAAIVPCLSMRFGVDYRRLFWADYSQLVRGVQLRVQDAVAGDGPASETLSSFLCPAETDRTILTAYSAALASHSLTTERNELLHLIAFHHVALALKREGSGGSLHETIARAEGGEQLLAALVRYKQESEPGKALVLPPACFA